VIEEFLRTGRSAAYEELRTATPIGLFDLMRIPGLGTSASARCTRSWGSTRSTPWRRRRAPAGRLTSRLRREDRGEDPGGDRLRARQPRAPPLPEALEAAARLVDAVRALPGVLAAEIVGALRRRLEVVDEVELVVAAARPGAVRAALGRLNGLAAAEAVGEGTEARLPDGLLVRVRCVEPAAFVAAVVWETGSDPHRDALAARAAERGMRLDASGLWKGEERVEPADERALYAALGLAYVQPELREGLGEVERAAAGELRRGWSSWRTCAGPSTATPPTRTARRRWRRWRRRRATMGGPTSASATTRAPPPTPAGCRSSGCGAAPPRSIA
jgi:DNA polymerase (family X)